MKTKFYFKNKKKSLKFHIAHNEGNYFCSNDQIKDIRRQQSNSHVKYCDENGNINEESNPNGSYRT